MLGHIAGKMTKTNKIGYIGSFPIPEVIRGINASYHPREEGQPGRRVRRSSGPTPGSTRRKRPTRRSALIEQGADVILQHTDSTAPQAAAPGGGRRDHLRPGLGHGGIRAARRASSRSSTTGRPTTSSASRRVMDGTWEIRRHLGRHRPDGDGRIGEITDGRARGREGRGAGAEGAIAAGEYHPFTGPLNKQDGSVWLAEGETADDGTLLGMDFYVEGHQRRDPELIPPRRDFERVRSPPASFRLAAAEKSAAVSFSNLRTHYLNRCFVLFGMSQRFLRPVSGGCRSASFCQKSGSGGSIALLQSMMRAMSCAP